MYYSMFFLILKLNKYKYNIIEYYFLPFIYKIIKLFLINFEQKKIYLRYKIMIN